MWTIKARTAVLRGRPSSAFATRVRERPGFLLVSNCLGVDGGVPILFDGGCLGGIGVSGIGQDDESRWPRRAPRRSAGSDDRSRPTRRRRRQSEKYPKHRDRCG
jgi:hypothetical protein